VYLKRLEIQGFKTFATRTVFEFRPGITAVVGPNGSGKCTSGNTLVTLADGRDVPIRDLVEAALNDAHIVEALDDGLVTLENPQNIQIFSLNPITFRLEARPIAAFVKREATPYLLCVRTRSGREVTATPCHPLFTLENGQLQALKAEELKVGARLALPRRLSVQGKEVQLPPFEIIEQFGDDKGMSVPTSAGLREWADTVRPRFRTWLEWSRTAKIPHTQLNNLRKGNSIEISALLRLARAAELAPPLDGRLKARFATPISLPSRFTAELARFLGLLIAEGYILPERVEFINSDTILNNVFQDLSRSLFGIEAGRHPHSNFKAEDVTLRSRTLVLALERVFKIQANSGSAKKEMPPQLFQCDDEIKWAFLSGLFEGDAHIHLLSSTTKRTKKQAYIEYTTASRRLADQVVSLLLRLGVFATIRPKVKYAANTVAKHRRTYYSVYIYGADQLRHTARNLSFVGEKRVALQALRELPQANNPNHDLIPGITPLVKEAVRLAGVSIKRHRSGRPKLAAYTEQRCEASRGGLLEVTGQIAQLGTTPERASDQLHRLTALATSDVYWDEIVSVEQVVPPDPWVYDLSVAETHNFVAGNIVVHNSNIADAVRWVLGEQSYAALRSKRTEDLLFSGGGRRAPAGLAEVSLTVDNSDRLLPLPYGEVTITRRATRAGENEYFINRNRVRLRDVQEAVGPLGGSYTIINQGLVDAALTLRPEERRRLFEDAAEISVFESRKHDAERKLRETETNLERCADVLTELEPRLRSLKRQASLARSYRDLNAELRGLLLQHYAAQWRGAQQALATTEANEQSLAGALELCRAEQAAATVALRAARDQLRVLRERLGALHAESSALHSQAEAVQRDLAVGNERQAALIRRGEEFQRSLNEFDLRREELDRERVAVAARMAAAETHLAEQRAAVRAIEGELAERETERRAMQRALDAAQRAELEATAALAERRRRTEQLAAQRERLVHEQAGAADTLTAAERTLAERKAALSAAQERLASADQAAKSALAVVEQAGGTIDALRTERAGAEEMLAQARRALADTEARLETLARLQRSYAGAFAGVKAAMQWAEAEKRSGFTLVSSIIRTPAQIETAIEVALGSRLQNIVVERWSDAEDAIEALKRGGQGRATFLPLDTIRTKNQERAPAGSTSQEAGGSQLTLRVPVLGFVLGIAADLVDFDGHYQPVVQHLLGRTLVVEDLATARQTLRQIAGGWTLVTLAGEQVSGGGAVTGGAQTKETGTLRRERELRELPEQIDKQRTIVEVAAQARAALEARMSAAERELHEAESARQRAVQDLELVRGSSDRARRAADQAEIDLELQRRRHDQSAAAIQDLSEQQAALHEEQAALEAREQEAHAQLTRLRAEDQGRLDAERELQQRAAALRAAMAAAEGEARAEQTLLQSNNQNLARLADQRRAGERRLDELAGERATLEAQLGALQTSHARLLDQIDDLRSRIGPSEAEQSELEATQSNLERQESELTSALLAAESTHGRVAVEVQRTRDRLDTIWERAAADDIDIESVVSGPLSVVSTTDNGPQTTDNEQGTTDVDLETQIQVIKAKIQRLGVVNPLALEEYEEESKRHSFMTTQIADLRQAEAALRELIVELDSAMQMRFEATFRAVAAEFERSFTRLFGGGQAQLLLTRPDGGNGNGESHESVEGMGVEILARPPGKRQQTLSLLSGGERTLTASALLFAILKVNPSPFCVLDEVDAALDEANVGRFREALADLSEQTQFLLVTHNRGTIEAADTIYGVSMGEDGASRVLSLRLEELIGD